MATTTKFLEPGTDATQDFSFFASTSGTVASDTTSYTGPRSIKCSTGSPGVTALITSLSSLFSDTGTQISFYFRVDALPSSDGQMFAIRNGSNSQTFRLVLRTTGILGNVPVGGTTVNGTTTLAANTWYRICISYYVTNTTTYTYKVYVDGTLDSTTSAGTLTNTGGTKFEFGPTGGAGANLVYRYENWYVATGGADSSAQPDTGNILVTAKRPNANGTANQFTTQIGSGGSGYGTGHSSQVNEQPLSTTNGWSIQSASLQTEEYTIENASTGDVDLTGATLVDYMGWIYAKVGSASTGNIIVNNVTTNKSLTTSYAFYSAAAASTTYPGGNTDIGMDNNTVNQLFSLAECGIVFAYKPAAVAVTGGTLPMMGVG